jgi:hypothetical protein
MGLQTYPITAVHSGTIRFPAARVPQAIENFYVEEFGDADGLTMCLSFGSMGDAAYAQIEYAISGPRMASSVSKLNRILRLTNGGFLDDGRLRSYQETQSLFDERDKRPRLRMSRTRFLRPITSDIYPALAGVVDLLARPSPVRCSVFIESLGRYHSDLSRNEGSSYPCRGFRNNLMIIAMWKSPQERLVAKRVLDEAFGVLKPYCATLGYANYLSDAEEDVRQVLTLPRIAKLRKVLDPSGMFGNSGII